MFRKIMKHLTYFNSVVKEGALLVFITITFAGVIWGVYSDEKKDILGYAKEEMEENRSILINKVYLQPGFQPEETSGNKMMFYSVYDNQGRLVRCANVSAKIRGIINQKIQVNNIRDGQLAVLITKQIRPKVKLMFTVLTICEGATVYGKIYVGKSIAGLHRIVITLFFLALTTVFGFIMAGLSFTPIKRSYEKQREFLADASYELRTPLNILLASVESIQGDTANRMTGSSGEALIDMKDRIKKMTKTVNDLLTLVYTDTTTFNIVREHFNLCSVAEQVITAIHPLTQTKNIGVQLIFPEQITVYADRERLAQLFSILLENTVEYTNNGGQVRITIRRLMGHEGFGVEIVVQDNGTAIATEKQKVIIERFNRINKVRSLAIGGSGLGMPIAKWIAELHGGSIAVISKPGVGACFVVFLPL
jgi:signal transduction histidine kinase